MKTTFFHRWAICALFYLLPGTLAFSQAHNKVMSGMLSPLMGTYNVSFRAEGIVQHYILAIDKIDGMYFYGELIADKKCHPTSTTRCKIKGMIAGHKKYEFVLRPDLSYVGNYNLHCRKADFVLNNTLKFSLDNDSNELHGVMVTNNTESLRALVFNGKRREP